MISASKRITIDRSPEEVWRYLTDFPAHTEWVEELVDVRLSPEPIGVGSFVTEIREYGGRKVEGVEEVVEWVPLQRLRTKTPSGSLQADSLYILEPIDHGTQLDYAIHIKGYGLGKILEWIVRGNFQKSVDVGFDRFKLAIENRSTLVASL